MFQQSSLPSIKRAIAAILDKIPAHFTYHNLNHALDVMKQADRIAIEEGIGEHDRALLQVAALFHDAGYPEGSHVHEERGCKIFEQESAQWDFSPEEITQVKKLIMATKVPQTPRTKLEEIICDADLDYLGREDFFRLGEGLKKEFLYFGVLKNAEDWDEMQAHFLEKHRYFTTSSKRLREPVKRQHLSLLKQR